MVRRCAGRPSQPAGSPPYPAADASNHSPFLKSPKSQFRHYNALAGGDIDVDVTA